METKTLVFLTHSTTTYQIREETFEGRRYLVVPVVMMVEGVHEGSRGPLLHTAEELSRYTSVWNGIPITIHHPQQEGQYVSANSPELLEMSVGRVFNTYMDGNKLKAEAWLDSSRLLAFSPEAAEYIRQGKPLEVSVGVFNDEIDKEGEWQDEHYTAIATNHRPDHLALLPGGRGACSWQDGCGIRVNEKGGNMKDDLKESLKSLNKQGYSVIPIVNKQGYQELMNSLRAKLDAMDTPDRMYFLVEVYDDSMVYEVRNRETEGSTLYKRGYSVSEQGEVSLEENPAEVRRKIEFISMDEQKAMRRTKFNNNKKEGGNEMACCEDKVDRLIANSQTKFTSEDKDWLMGQDEAHLDKMMPKAETKKSADPTPQVNKDEVVNEFKGSLKTIDDYTALMPDEMKTQVQKGLEVYQKNRDTVISAIVNNSDFTAEELTDYTDEVLQKLQKSVTKADYSAAAGGSSKQNDENEEKLLPIGVE